MRLKTTPGACRAYAFEHKILAALSRIFGVLGGVLGVFLKLAEKEDKLIKFMGKNPRY